MADRFDICLPLMLRQECPFPDDWSNPKNFSHDRHDPGGATMCGIIQREYDVWRKGHGLPTQPVNECTEGEGTAIYRICYWLPHCPMLPPGLDLSFLDAAVNMGTTEAIRILQWSLQIANDGKWGQQTSAAVTLSFNRTPQIIADFTARRHKVYREMPGYQYFHVDWERRATEIGQQSMKMT